MQRRPIRCKPIKGFCYFCHSTEDLTIDHIVPRSLGGTNERKNLQVLCSYCNGQKGNLPESEIVRLFRWFKYIDENRKEPLNW